MAKGKISKAAGILKWGWKFLVLLTEGLSLYEAWDYCTKHYG